MYQQPPAVISTKDCYVFNRYAFMEFISYEKGTFLCSALSRILNLKTEFDRCGQMHQRHYERILTHLNTQNQNQAQYKSPNVTM